jgi:hypothetical protein
MRQRQIADDKLLVDLDMPSSLRAAETREY